MSNTTINIGWLKNNNEQKFAPKTLSAQAITENASTTETGLNAKALNSRNTNKYLLDNDLMLNYQDIGADYEGKLLTKDSVNYCPCIDTEDVEGWCEVDNLHQEYELAR